MLSVASIILPGLLASIVPVRGQTFTDCNPTQKECPIKPGLPSTSYSIDFSKGPDPANWEPIGTGSINFTESGAEFSILKQGDNPTLQTSWYFLFGRAEVRLRSANGQGIVTAVVLESDVLDEIDWEWLGGTPNEVQTNYFGKGNTSVYDRGGRTPVPDSQMTTNIYTMDWSPEAIQWSLNGVVVRTLAYNDANGRQNYPQTPMRLKLGIWAGGDPGNPKGTIQWAGGPTDFRQAPFTMFVERVSITNDAPAISYRYGDFSGSWESIIVEAPPAVSVPQQELQVVGALPVDAASVLGTGSPAPAAVAPAPATVAPAPETFAPAPGTGSPVTGAGAPAPATVAPATATVAPASGTGAPLPESGTPAQANVNDELQVAALIQEDVELELPLEEDAEGEVSEGDAEDDE